MKKLLLAISGGIDSTVLLDALAYDRLDQLVDNSKFKIQNSKLILAYFNHGTPHGKQAEQHVKKLAARYHLPLHIGRTKKALKSEADFRTARYIYLRTLKKKLHCDRIVTAHTADDQAETLLLNLIRGAGLAGLAAMQEDTGEILRPLLQVTKSDIIAYANKHHPTWIEDPTNIDPHLRRNTIRHNILPLLARINPQIITALTRTARIARDHHRFVSNSAIFWLSSQRIQQRAQHPTTTQSNTSIQLAIFNALPAVFRGEIIRAIYRDTIGNLTGLEEVHIEEVLTLAQNPAGNKQKKCGELIFRTAKEGSTRVLRWEKTAKISRLTKRA